MYRSIFHWKPLLNGYTGYAPRSASTVVGIAKALPDADAVRILQRMTGVRYVVVHLAELTPRERFRWRRWPGLKLVDRFGNDLLLEVRERVKADLLETLLDGSERGRTMLGSRLRGLDPARQSGFVQVTTPSFGSIAVPRHLRVPLSIRLANQADYIWPVLAEDSDYTVAVAYVWRQAGKVVGQGRVPIPYDLAPGNEVEFQTGISAPAVEGKHTVEVSVVQGATRFRVPPYVAELEVRRWRDLAPPERPPSVPTLPEESVESARSLSRSASQTPEATSLVPPVVR